MKRYVWDIDDIGQALLAARANLLLAGVDGDYRRGFEACLVTLSLAFGLDCGTIGLTAREEVSHASGHKCISDGYGSRWIGTQDGAVVQR